MIVDRRTVGVDSERASETDITHPSHSLCDIVREITLACRGRRAKYTKDDRLHLPAGNWTGFRTGGGQRSSYRRVTDEGATARAVVAGRACPACVGRSTLDPLSQNTPPATTSDWHA